MVTPSSLDIFWQEYMAYIKSDILGIRKRRNVIEERQIAKEYKARY